MPEWVQIIKIIWYYIKDITEQPTVGNDKDKIPASSGIELGWFLRNSNNVIYFIMVCKIQSFPDFAHHIMNGL